MSTQAIFFNWYFWRCKDSLGQPQHINQLSKSHVLFYSYDDLFGSVSCRFSLISKHDIPCAKAVLRIEVIFCRLMGTFIEVQPRNFIYFSLERPGMGLILDGIHNKSEIKEVSGEN